MGRRPNPAVIGAFVVGAVVLAVVGVLVLGSGRYFRATMPVVVYFTGSVNGLAVGAPVKFKGVPVGDVRDIRLNIAPHERAAADVRIPVLIELDQGRIAEQGVRTGVDEKTLRRLIDEGLRAQLSTESFVTGVLYVALDLRPGTPVRLVSDPTVPYVEIPALPTAMEAVQDAAGRIVSKLENVDLDELVAAASRTLQGLDRILSTREAQALPASTEHLLRTLDETADQMNQLATNANGMLVPKLTTALDAASGALRDAGETFRTLQSTFEPSAPLGYRLERALAGVTSAAGAIEGLAEQLERDPSSLVRGRSVSQDSAR
ncbi:MAG TPA: MlaD family protein [Candidatus Binatia bacterium]|nr:MlaD family protein [Candidatus Binatia bacterium]